MLVSWKRFDAFSIRIFEFSEPTDLIVGAVREPNLTIVLVLFTIMGLSMLPFLGLLNSYEFLGLLPDNCRRPAGNPDNVSMCPAPSISGLR